MNQLTRKEHLVAPLFFVLARPGRDHRLRGLLGCQAVARKLFERFHGMMLWHQYFLALRRGESGELHRRLAESLETAKSHCAQIEAPAKQVRKTPFINRDFTKKFLLEAAHLNRAHKFDQVSEETLQMLNVIVRTWCVNHIRHLPSKGKRV